MHKLAPAHHRRGVRQTNKATLTSGNGGRRGVQEAWRGVHYPSEGNKCSRGEGTLADGR
jgi:hypothetical protein